MSKERTATLFIIAVVLIVGIVGYHVIRTVREQRQEEAPSATFDLLSANEAKDRAYNARVKEEMKSIEDIMKSVNDDISTSSRLGYNRTMAVVKFAKPEVVKAVIGILKSKGYTVMVETGDETPDVLYIMWN